MPSTYQVLSRIVSDSGAPVGPYLIPPSFPQDRPDAPLVIDVPYVRGSAPASAACAIARGGDNTDFSLAWAPSNAPSVAKVTVQPAHLYSDKPEDRAALFASFNAFRVALEQMELGSQQCLAPGGADAVVRAVAASIPLRLDEVLAYHYGLARGGNVVDLAPGMRLRIDTGGYDFVAPSSAWNGFGAAGGSTCTVARSSAQDVCFDAFLGTMATSVPLGTPAWIGGLADLAALGPRRHFRLVYPRTATGPRQTSAAPAFGRAPALLGADTLTDLAAATTAYFKDGTCVTATSGRPVVSAAFAGRTSVVPEILVKILGEWRYLPVGSTMQQLLDLYSPLFRWQLTSVDMSQKTRLNRVTIAGLQGNLIPFGPTAVTFSQTTQYIAQPNGGQLSQWDLPLLQGDTFTSPWLGV